MITEGARDALIALIVPSGLATIRKALAKTETAVEEVKETVDLVEKKVEQTPQRVAQAVAPGVAGMPGMPRARG